MYGGLSVCLSACPCMSVCRCVGLLVCLSVCMYVCLSSHIFLVTAAVNSFPRSEYIALERPYGAGQWAVMALVTVWAVLLGKGTATANLEKLSIIVRTYLFPWLSSGLSGP